MKAKAKTNKPVADSFTLTMTPEEATLLVKFMGPTRLSTVQELLPNADPLTVQKVNDVLSDVYNVLIDAGVVYHY